MRRSRWDARQENSGTPARARADPGAASVRRASASAAFMMELSPRSARRRVAMVGLTAFGVIQRMTPFTPVAAGIYIGGGLLVVILIIVVIFLVLRR
jgi:hypothetical protein